METQQIASIQPAQKIHHWKLISSIILVIIFILTAGYFYFLNNGPAFKSLNYSDNYRLVPEKISQSAPIQISLPEGTDKTTAQKATAFDPVIKGTWKSENNGSSWIPKVLADTVNSNFIVFQPEKPLDLNKHYAVKIDLGNGQILASDFLSVENPKVVAVFPKPDSEAPEDAKITIVFNRPMVPLTTLEVLEAQKIPVEILPKTDGKFKWISTNTLQFIPKDRLQRSSNYDVRVNSFSSLDNLTTQSFEGIFQTAILRYADQLQPGQIPQQIYDQPYTVYFNQPFDLEKTKGEIKITNKTTGAAVPVFAKYGTKEVQDQSQNPQYKQGDSFGASIIDWISNAFSTKQETDKTVLEIYPATNSNGRQNFWDTNANYSITIDKAYPAEGDIIIDQQNSIDIITTDIVNYWQANSKRTNADLDMFDPQGYLAIGFFEDIDLSKSAITGSNIKSINYGKKCQDPNDYDRQNCPKVDNRKEIDIYFNADQIKPSDKLTVNLEKIYNDSGLLINGSAISQKLSVYGPLQFSVAPISNIGQNYADADTYYLTGFYICSNNPLQAPENKDLNKKIIANKDYQIKFFGPSLKVWQGSPCQSLRYYTWISAGFAPETKYTVTFSLDDVFGQNSVSQASFTTGKMNAQNVQVFGLQQRYSVVSPNDARVGFGTQNIDYVNLEICKVLAIDLKRLYTNNKSDSLACLDRKTDKISLPQKYWMNNYFDIKIANYFDDPVGNYVITLNHPLLLDWQKQPYDYTAYLTVTNLAVVEKTIAPATDYLDPSGTQLSQDQLDSLKNIYWVTDIKTQQPIAGVKINFYDRNLNSIGSATTNSDGIAQSSPVAGVDAVVASFGADNTVIMQSQDKLAWAQNAQNYRQTYIFTDKPLYRPTQTAHIKGIARIGYDGNYQMFDEKTVAVTITDSKGAQILNKGVDLNDFGTFNLDFEVPKDASLGTYSVCVQTGYSCSYFDLLEYVPAAFQVASKSDKQEYVSKNTANIQVDANYYFGAPVMNANVDYTISSQNYYFDKYQGDDWYNFGYWSSDYYNYSGYYYGDRFATRGSGKTDDNGNYNFSQKLDLTDILKDSQSQGSRIIAVDTTVKNNLGQSISSQTSFILHAGEFYIGVKTDPYFAGKNQDFNLKVKTVDTQGNNTSQSNLTADVYKNNWNYAKRQDMNGAFTYVWEKQQEKVKSINFSTDNSGNASQKMNLGSEGEYEIVVSGYDSLENLIKSNTYIYIFGTGSATFMFSDKTNLTVKASKTELKPGEQGQLIIESPFQKAKALITIERGKIFDYQIVDVMGNIYGYTFIAKEDYAPNVYVSALLLSPDPSVKFGSQQFTIDSNKPKLDVKVTPDKQSYSPGENIRLDILAKNSDNKPVQAEISIAIVDKSVLALKGNPKKDPISFFYNGFPLTVATASNIVNAISRIEPADSNKTKGGSGGGGSETKARGDFRETAFWTAAVLTDSNGKAQISFKLPDNLTTWQAETLAVTKDTKLGINYTEFMSKKDLMVVPLKPRFILPGDNFSVGAQIFNQTNTAKNFKVTFKSDTLDKGNQEKNITVGANQSQALYFSTKAPESQAEGSHSFTISAEGSGLSDAVVQIISINQNLTYEVTATANYTQGDRAAEVIYLPSNVSQQKGELSIRSSATLAVFLSNALNYLISYPYGCSEQISSQLKAIAIVKNGLKVPNLSDKFQLKKIKIDNKEYTADQLVDIGLTKLYSRQNADGGFSFWDGAGKISDFYGTLRVVDTLQSLKKAGYQVSDSSINQGADYLFNFFNMHDNLYWFSNEQKISLARVLFNTNKYRGNSNLLQAVSKIISNDAVFKDQLSMKSLAELGIMAGKGQLGFFEKIKVQNALDNHINIDSRGAFLQPNENNFYYAYFESTISDTALYLDSLALSRRETSINDKIVRWLLASRDKDGAWGSTQNSLAVVEAFTDYLNWKKETTANYVLDTNLNGKTISTYGFNKSTILNQDLKSVPVSNLKVNNYNPLVFNKNGQGSLYYDLALKYYLSGNVQPRDEGFTITRQFYALGDKDSKNPIQTARAGDLVREHLTVIAPVTRNHVQIEDYIPAGMEIVDLSLATETKSLRLNEVQVKAPEISPDFKEIRDDRAYIYTNQLNPGVYEFDYYVRALVPGSYMQLPAIVSEMYTPENFGRTSSSQFQVTN